MRALIISRDVYTTTPDSSSIASVGSVQGRPHLTQQRGCPVLVGFQPPPNLGILLEFKGVYVFLPVGEST